MGLFRLDTLQTLKKSLCRFFEGILKRLLAAITLLNLGIFGITMFRDGLIACVGRRVIKVVDSLETFEK